MGSVSYSKAHPISLKYGALAAQAVRLPQPPRPPEARRKETPRGEPQNPEGLQRSETGGGCGEAWGHGWAGPLTSFMPRQFFSRLL